MRRPYAQSLTAIAAILASASGWDWLTTAGEFGAAVVSAAIFALLVADDSQKNFIRSAFAERFGTKKTV